MRFCSITVLFCLHCLEMVHIHVVCQLLEYMVSCLKLVLLTTGELQERNYTSCQGNETNVFPKQLNFSEELYL